MLADDVDRRFHERGCIDTVFRERGQQVGDGTFGLCLMVSRGDDLPCSSNGQAPAAKISPPAVAPYS